MTPEDKEYQSQKKRPTIKHPYLNLIPTANEANISVAKVVHIGIHNGELVCESLNVSADNDEDSPW